MSKARIIVTFALLLLTLIGAKAQTPAPPSRREQIHRGPF